MFKHLVLAAIIASSINAMDFESRAKEVDVVSGVRHVVTFAYLNAFADLEEIDPLTKEVFAWAHAIDYEFFRSDPAKADIFTRYKHAIIRTAHTLQIPAKDLPKAQALLDQNGSALFYVLHEKGTGTLDPCQWAHYWTQLKREITKRSKEMDAKCLECKTED
jgi:hypothetical protein